MVTIDSVLRRSLADRGGDFVLTLDPAFQGLPDAAHGGSVLAAFDALAGLLRRGERGAKDTSAGGRFASVVTASA